MELWGGVECTVNRVGDRYRDQLLLSGHDDRPEDLERIAELGFRRLRYPVLWERCARALSDAPSFERSDAALGQLRRLGLDPIVGLVHHGSGPRGASLCDEHFAPGLARFAGAVARRYPWVTAYTPVNEPLTTARFSGLYGHWYPHGRDDRSFVRAVLTQVCATVEAMRAIRRVQPRAALVQTEDLGTVFSTPRLAPQAAFENERRFLCFDLLAGRVDRTHPLYGYLRAHGADERALARLVDDPCPTDLLGVNYYVTSDRWLDERLERYPAHYHGDNGQMRYADLEAVRARPEGIGGQAAVLELCAERYRVPVALTEVHLGCTAHEQVRWLDEAWTAALHAASEGVDVRAVTLWSLLGSYDWDSLCTLERGHYEPGAFDVRSGRAIPTPLAMRAMELSGRARPSALARPSEPGWWRRGERLLYRDAPHELSPLCAAP